MSYAISHSKSMKLKVHVNKEGKILGLEIPKEELVASNAKIESPTVPEGCTCTKGLSECVKELDSKKLVTTMVIRRQDYSSTPGDAPGDVVNLVVSGLPHENLNVQQILEDPEYDSYKALGCPNYDPIHGNYANIRDCSYCSLWEACTEDRVPF